ncbi:hypothetical protein FCJ60_03045 [Burkholderia metallica]|nr:hypothetical protein [Burkholderia metallica]
MRLRSVGQASRRVRPVQRTRRPGLSGRRPGRGARDHATRRGRRHGSTRYASIADDSQVDRDRPIKCCDDIHSISHYPPAPATRGREALRSAPTIREILTVAMFWRCVRARQHSVQAPVSMHRVTRIEDDRYMRGSGSLRQGRGIHSVQVGTSRRVEGKADVIRPTLSGRIRTRQAMSSRNGENGGRRMAGPSIGHMAAADAAGGESPVWPAKRPGRAPG